jgi:hypothetical protein
VDETDGAEILTDNLPLPAGCRLAYDASDRKAVLFDSEWVEKFFRERHPKVRLLDLPRRPRPAHGS